MKKLPKQTRELVLSEGSSAFFFRNALFTIYKSSVRFQIDYCDIVHDQTNNDIFSNNFQYNAALYITGAIKDVFVPSSKLR